MEGQRSDHMAISPDGKRVLVSDSTANKVHELDAATGKKVGEFASGDSPHENNYSADGRRIFHASIGLVYTPTDQPVADSTKGDRFFQVVEAGTNKILKQLDIGKILADNGFAGYSSAVRPMAIAPDEKIIYMQLSFFHGFVVFDVVNDKPLKLVDLPKKTTEPRENYLLDSAHHGLSISPDGSKLCAAGTMDGYAAIVSTADYSFKLIEPVDKPYWSTNSGDGRYCFVSASGSDEVVVVDYATASQVARIPVGDHPQRMRMGVIRDEYVGGPTAGAAATRAVSKLRLLRARLRSGFLALRLRINEAAAGGTVKVTYRVRKRRTSFRVRVPAASRARDGMITWNVSKRLPRALRRRAAGRVEVTFAGTSTVVSGRDRQTARR
jgi:YVTN family beta-propeller protein